MYAAYICAALVLLALFLAPFRKLDARTAKVFGNPEVFATTLEKQREADHAKFPTLFPSSFFFRRRIKKIRKRNTNNIFIK